MFNKSYLFMQSILFYILTRYYIYFLMLIKFNDFYLLMKRLIIFIYILNRFKFLLI